ncbi:helix-turn-helix domain-containing protein [Candidatus Pacearchaeota archaeon]|nr:helix-turn-helix domain-containing protein [Candidatus Pacearchaeota archaeon]
MSKTMPQEIEVWYLIPALRRELARIFIEKYDLSQKKAAEILGITESAISQYFSSKRGSEVKFSNKEIIEIEKTAESIIKKNKSVMKGIYDLCIKFRENKTICDLHKNQDKSIPKNCNVCFEK